MSKYKVYVEDRTCYHFEVEAVDRDEAEEIGLKMFEDAEDWDDSVVEVTHIEEVAP
jgi:hypothetical protein